MALKLPDSPQVRAFYQLAPGETLRLAPRPFPAERMVPDKPPRHPGASALWPWCRTFRWENNSLENGMAAYGLWDAAAFIHQFLNVFPQELAGDVAASQIPLSADFVFRGVPDQSQYKTAIEQLLSLAMGTRMALTYRKATCAVIVLRGSWSLPEGTPRVEIGPDFGELVGHAGNGSIDQFGKTVGGWLRRIVVIQALGAPSEISWQCRHIRSGTREQAELCRDVNLVCQRISDQTGLTRVDTTMEVTQLFIEPAALT